MANLIYVHCLDLCCYYAIEYEEGIVFLSGYEEGAIHNLEIQINANLCDFSPSPKISVA